MNDKLAAKRYAAALVAAAKEKELAEILSSLDAVASLFSNKKFTEKIKSPLMPNAEKVNAIVSAFGAAPRRESNSGSQKTSKQEASVSPSLTKLSNLIALLAEKNRLCALPHIVKEVKIALAGKRSSYEGIVDAQTPIDKAKLDALAKSLTKRLGAEIKLTQSNRRYDGVRAAIDDLGVEVDFSKTRISSQILGHILRGL
ncbi:MAG: F0F1 ATP synthase subunit delta [Helicobacteraceae bacterium]|jgi:F-type H+-transporting ATPase subunit delta|nr:F0F1 ATP synthase subunit delta [Helicobacteraceae bacterium]